MPAERVTVYPAQPNAVGMKHPHDCPLAKGGSEWPLDSFTCRRLTDGSVTREAPAPAEAPAEPATTETPAA